MSGHLKLRMVEKFVQRIRELDTLLIFTVLFLFMGVSFIAFYFIDKVICMGSCSEICGTVFVVWLATLWNLTGLIAIINKEVPRFPPYAPIKGGLAVLLGIITIIIGIVVQIMALFV